MYKLLPGGPGTEPANAILRTTDNAVVPMDQKNRDYQEYLEWVAQGNTPEPADEAPE